MKLVITWETDKEVVVGGSLCVKVKDKYGREDVRVCLRKIRRNSS